MGVLLTDLTKSFDCLSHAVLIIKLAAYGFDFNSLQMLKSYFSNRKQGTKNDACSLVKFCLEYKKVYIRAAAI